MTDLALCSNNRCPSHKTCKRWLFGQRKDLSPWQTWSQFAPLPYKQSCKFYISATHH